MPRRAAVRCSGTTRCSATRWAPRPPPWRAPRAPWHEPLIYELHVKGVAQQHPDVPARLRGTYLGLASEAAIDHLVRLGVTAVELMPVHHHTNEWLLVQ